MLIIHNLNDSKIMRSFDSEILADRRRKRIIFHPHAQYLTNYQLFEHNKKTVTPFKKDRIVFVKSLQCFPESMQMIFLIISVFSQKRFCQPDRLPKKHNNPACINNATPCLRDTVAPYPDGETHPAESGIHPLNSHSRQRITE